MENESGARFQELTQQWQKLMTQGLQDMTKMFDPAGLSAASTSYLEWTRSAQKQSQSQGEQFMDAMEFPKRGDVERLHEQLGSAESRIAACESTLSQILQALRALEASLAPKAALAPTPEAATPEAPPKKAAAPKKAASSPKTPAPAKTEAKPKAAATEATPPAKAAAAAPKAPASPAKSAARTAKSVARGKKGKR